MNRRTDLLGYHPSKEIAFLGNDFDGFAYYLGSSKLQYLGTFYPVGCGNISQCCSYTHESFIDTPCMDDLLSDHKNTQLMVSQFAFYFLPLICMLDDCTSITYFHINSSLHSYSVVVFARQY
jgi:hypothetical protein